MPLDFVILLGILAVALVLLATEKVPAEGTAVGVLLATTLTGLIPAEAAFAGFANPAVITVVAMFVISAGLIEAGVADRVGGWLVRAGGTSAGRLTALIMVGVGALSAFMNNIGAVTILLPAVISAARRADVAPSRLLMPLAFGSLLGGLTTLIGTPPNILVASMLRDAGVVELGIFDLAPIGLSFLATGVVFFAVAGNRVLPQIAPAPELTELFRIKEYLSEVEILEKSPLVGKTLAESGLRDKYGLDVVRLIRDRRNLGLPHGNLKLRAHDVLVVEAPGERLLAIKDAAGLAIHPEARLGDETLAGAKARLAEVVLSPDATLAGKTAVQLQFRQRYGLLILAIRRQGQPLRGRLDRVRLRFGDALLVQGPPDALAALADDPDFLVIDLLEYRPANPRKAPLALAILAGAVVLATARVVEISVAATLGALAMVLAGCLKPDAAYRAIQWKAVFVIGGMMALGAAMEATGAADRLGAGMAAGLGALGPRALLGGIMLVTMLLTQIMSNAAAAVILTPVAIALGASAGVSPVALAVGVAVAASSAFLTPFGHQANILVYVTGRYRFADFTRAGFLLTVLTFLLGLVIIPLVFPF